MANKNLSTELGFKFRSLREKLGIKQEDLAVQIGISQATLSKIENGDVEVTLSRIEKLCNALGIDTLEFLATEAKMVTNNVFHNHNQVEANILNGNKVQNIYQLNKEDLQEMMMEFFNKVNNDNSKT